MRALLVAFALALPACAGSPNAATPATPTGSSAAPAGPVQVARAHVRSIVLQDAAFAPIPYTADQIRESCTGRTIVFRVETEGKPTVRKTIRFLSATPVDAEVESSISNDEGRPVGEPKRERAHWDELRKHGAFPREKTTIAPDRVTTPAGTFATHAYKVIDEDGSVTTFQFADELPGPPVLYFIEKNGARVMSATMIASSRAQR